jgi:hypothetical protein
MTREELQTNQEYMWRALFGEQQTTLTLAVEMLLRCHLSPEQILTKTMTLWKARSKIPERFFVGHSDVRDN